MKWKTLPSFGLAASSVAAGILAFEATERLSFLKMFNSIEKTASLYVLLSYIAMGATFALFSKEISSFVRRIMRTPRVVVLHNNEQGELIERVESKLRAQKVAVWNDMSDLDVGDEIFPTIQSKIVDADALVIFLTKKSPEYIIQMADLAIEVGVRIIPIVDKNVEVPPHIKRFVPIFSFEGDDYIANGIKKAVWRRHRQGPN